MVATTASADDISAPFNGSQIVILGEIHDNPFHHANQARIVAELAPSALVFEMVEPADARKITPEIRENAADLERALNWEARGWPDFSMYFPVFNAAPEAAIFGAALPQEDVRRAIREGAAAVFGASAPLFGLDEALPEDQLASRTALQQDAHCGALPDSILPGMVEAQRLRDAALAKATVAALEHARASSDAPRVVVITGNGHARDDWGVPALLMHFFKNEPDVTIATLGQFELEAPDEMPFTSFLVTDPAEREDPCAAFR